MRSKTSRTWPVSVWLLTVLSCARRPALAGAQDAGAAPQAPARPPARPIRSRASRSTASRCSTSVTTSSRSTRTGSTRCASPSCRRSRSSSAATTTRLPASGRAASASAPRRRPTLGELKTTFEFELFGTGVDEGQTTFRLRHAYGELGAFGAGQYWSPFMDPDVFPNSVEYWGPTGMVFFRNVQVRWMPVQGDARRRRSRSSGRAPAATQGIYADRDRAAGHQGAVPDARYLGRLQATAGTGATSEPPACSASIKWDDILDDAFELSGDATGWGINLSSNLKPSDERRDPPAVRVRRGHPELHERLAGRHRHRQQSRRTR